MKRLSRVSARERPIASLLFGGVTAASLLLSGAAPAEPIPEDRAGGAPRAYGTGSFLHFYGSTSVGRGVRWNNPFRLQTELGDDAESPSLTATYFDVAAAGLFGDPRGLQHGLGLGLSVALTGVPQEVLTPSYVGLVRMGPRWAVRARAGIPIVLAPDAGVGVELAFGGVFLFTAGLGVTAEVVQSVYYGAATFEKDVTVIPVTSGQLGVLVEYEVLP